MLRCKDLNKSFGTSKILIDVNIEVIPSQVTVLTGPNGSGKTTLIRALSLLDQPDSGTVELDNKIYRFDLNGKPNNEIPYPQITIVFQQLFLWPHLSNRQNITLAFEKLGDEENRRVAKLVDALEMHNFIDKYPNQSSLGQKQRIALARAIVLEPRYILLDEITSALDSHNADIVIKILKEQKECGTGILLVTHDLGFARKIGDHFFRMENGVIKQSDMAFES
jgi:ABC-type polar amino acid transport system ATPase subunit